MTLKLLSTPNHSTDKHLSVGNDVDAYDVAFDQTQHISLDFPKFSDGRAFSQAVVLRRRGFKGELCATGDVLIDQLVQMQRCGFSSALLRPDQNAEHGQRLLAHFAGFYQGDARGNLDHPPRFAHTDRA